MADAPAWAADSGLVTAVRPSPNHSERRGYLKADCLVLHYTGMADGASALSWLLDATSEVSCHYLVEQDGSVVQLVAESRRAWHAGRSFWAGETDLNSASIGIEIVNGGHAFGLPDFPARQIAAVVALSRDILARNRIGPARVLAHSDIAPGRKQDPGERFPWNVLARGGVGIWVPPDLDRSARLLPGSAGDEVMRLKADLARYGYGIADGPLYDDPLSTVVAAFQRRFRPSSIDGHADAGTLATLARLLDLRFGSLSAAQERARSRA